MNDVLVPFNELKETFTTILLKKGFTQKKAETCANIFAVNSLEGVYSHGANRFPRFIDYISRGFIVVNAEPELIHSAGALEQWNGRLGPGPLNALKGTERAIELAGTYGLGCVAMANTNHWMRGGTYGWQAAKKGCVFMGWTNTEANMPAWGAKDARLGNNPLVMAVPFKEEAIVLDFAMSQYSYGKMEDSRLKGKTLDHPGGFTVKGEMTTDPDKILLSRRSLPIGYWKGAGLSLLLDLLATILSSGLSTSEISKKDAEYGISQVYIVFDLTKLSNPAIEHTIHEIITEYKNSDVDENGISIRYPGERVILTRKKNLEQGIPLNPVIWDKIVALKQQ